MDMETGEVGDKFKPDFRGTKGSNIATLGHPTIGYTNMNEQPAQQAATVLLSAREDRVRYFEDRTEKFVPPEEDEEDDPFEDTRDRRDSRGRARDDNPFADVKPAFNP